jgi:hypothetical protein
MPDAHHVRQAQRLHRHRRAPVQHERRQQVAIA